MIKLNNVDYKFVLAVGAVGLVAYYVLSRDAVAAGSAVADGLGGAIDAAGSAVNPVSTDNILYRGVGALVDVFDDGNRNDSASLGTRIYEWFNEDPA